MNLIKEFTINESEKASQAEINHYIQIINKIYNEWKKTNRRINAVDIITTSVNKMSSISPEVVNKLHDTAKLKLAIILMRCFDLPSWKNPESKKSIYKKLTPILFKMQNHPVNTGSGGSLREVIETRLSSTLVKDSKNKVFVAYEPVISKSYINYLFGNDEKPSKIYKMQSLPFPEDFESLIDRLKTNQEKAESKLNK